MPTILISLLSKIGPYLAAAAVALMAGFYAGYHWCLPQVLQAQLALQKQEAADAAAAEVWDAKAASFQAALSTLQNQVQAARQTERQAAATAGGAQQAALAKQAALAGQDAPVAPVLLSEHDYLAKEVAP